MKKIAGSLLIAILGGIIALGAQQLFVKKENKYINSSPYKTPAYLASMPATAGNLTLPDFTVAASNTVHAVVHIKTEYNRSNNPYNNFFDFRDFFGNPGRGGMQPSPVEASGSGVIITPDGYIVTNNHVVSEADKITVTLNDKRTYEAKVIGTDPSTDLAVVKIEARDLPIISYGNSDNLQIGEWVLAVGNPFNLTSTVTAGIVSAKARNINILGSPDGSAIESFIQTDAAVNPGNSGGALVNTSGDLVGINAAIASGTGYYAGYSFAIPVNIVKKVAGDLIEYGTIQRGYMGVSIRDIDSKLADDEHLADIKGVYVADVTDDGAAKSAGMKAGDVILEIDGSEVNSTSELLGLIGQHRPGDKVQVTYKRGTKDEIVNVTLKNRDGNMSLVKRSEVDAESLLGAKLSPISSSVANNLGIDDGIQVAALKEGRLRDAGVRQGFIITRIDGKKIASVDDIGEILANKKGGVLIEGIYPNRTRAYYGFGM